MIPVYINTPCAITADPRYVPMITKKVTIIPLIPTFLNSPKSFPIATPAYAKRIVVKDTKSTLDV